MYKFKDGDTVRRIKGNHADMRVGDIDTITNYHIGSSMELSKFGRGHDPEKFELVNDIPATSDVSELPLEPGDILECISSNMQFSLGEKRTFKSYDCDGDLLLDGLSGSFTPERWKFVRTPISILRRKLEGPEPLFRKGDIVMMLGYGWGIGQTDEAPLGVPVEVLDVSSTGYCLLDFPEHSSKKVHPSALRMIKAKEGAKMKHTKTLKETCGVVLDYKGLSKPTTINEQMAHANRVLRDFIRKHTGQVWVCGGAPRNWDHGKMANDIDVYLYLQSDKGVDVQRQLAIRLGIPSESIRRLGADSPYKYTGNNIKFVFEVELAGQMYQFIITVTPIMDVVKDVLEHFNCDICRVAYDPIDFSFKRTTEYKTDRDFKRLTYRMYKLEKVNAELSMTRHVPKMMKYFPEHTVMIMQKDPDGCTVEAQDDPFNL